MAKRVAFFASKQDIENYYKIETRKESLFEPHYNLSPGHQLPVITLSEGNPEINRVRWGQMGSNQAENTTIFFEDLSTSGTKKNVLRCVIPLSGFYIWKEDQEKNHPFFVRLLNAPVMSVAGILVEGEENFVSIVTTESNVLVQPMTPHMPLLLNQELALKWLDPSNRTNQLLKQADNLFMLTDLSVLRVSKKVNDPANNNPKLIQPIPK